jgi:hypothetical protein
LLTVARADEILARAELSATQAANLSLGTQVDVQVSGRSLSGVVRAIGQARGATYLVDVAIPRSRDLVAGMVASLRWP